MPSNKTLSNAKKSKRDEFYTSQSDVERELSHYKNQFKGKIVYCNCDDPTTSAFWRYFYRSFDYLGLKMLISTHFRYDGGPSYALLFSGGKDENGQLYSNGRRFDGGTEYRVLKGNGDFRSKECVELLKLSDVIVTNPPFSLFREFVGQLMQYHKQFLIWGNQNSITYKEFFPYLMQNQVWIGGLANQTCLFQIPNNYPKYDQKATAKINDGHHYAKVPAITTFTNLSLVKSTDVIRLVDRFDQHTYPAYDNYAAFNVDRVANIPVDNTITAEIVQDRLSAWQKVYGDDLTVAGQEDDSGRVKVQIKRPIWGVPITFLDRYNPSSNKKDSFALQYDVLGATESEGRGFSHGIFNGGKVTQPLVNSKRKYKRVFIRKKTK